METLSSSIISLPTRVLVVAGSDSSGGAGIQADIKTVMALRGYAGTAITALTAQNTQGVFGIHPAPPEFVALQMQTFLDDIGADAVKTGMLFSAEIVSAVAEKLESSATHLPLVVDPVMAAKGGVRLLREDAERALAERLLPLATVVTPNIPEAELLSGIKVRDIKGMKLAAEKILASGAKAVLIKGGHLEGETVRDLLAGQDNMEIFESQRIPSTQTHGTGCTLASAIAVLLPKKDRLRDAVDEARRYVRRAIAAAPGLGHGYGPLGHGLLKIN